jgi:MFS family permease
MDSTRSKKYLLTVLPLIFAFTNLDRLTLALVLQDIKVDLSVSDTELGLLSGIAFALFYSVMGVPLARWADRHDRVLILSVTTAFACAAVVLCGFAMSFAQLLLIRVVVAVGEAGCTPTANSLIADYFPRAERARAISIFLAGGPISALVGYLAGGWLNEYFGWRKTFIVLGLPGMALAALAWFTLVEPRRKSVTHTLAVAQDSWRVVFATLWTNATFRRLLLCFAIASFFSIGIAKWQATFFVRSFGLSTAVIGSWFAMIYGFGSLLGIYLGGELATRYAACNERLQLRSIAAAYLFFAVIQAATYLSPTSYLAFAFMAISTTGLAATTAPLMSTIQTLVPDRMRAQAIAILFLFTNLIGMGLGPLAAGALSDALRPQLGEESLRYALLALSPGYFWAVWHVWHASHSVMSDLETTRRTC